MIRHHNCRVHPELRAVIMKTVAQDVIANFFGKDPAFVSAERDEDRTIDALDVRKVSFVRLLGGFRAHRSFERSTAEGVCATRGLANHMWDSPGAPGLCAFYYGLTAGVALLFVFALFDVFLFGTSAVRWLCDCCEADSGTAGIAL